MESNEPGKKPVFKRKGDLTVDRNIEVAPGIFIPEDLKDTWPQVEKTKRESIVISASPVSDPDIRASKFGGYPCIPAGFQYPKDKEGAYLFPLLQINCSELPLLKGFPTTGFLQCYISGSDGMYGMNPDAPADQQNFRVLYFTEDQVIKSQSDFNFLSDTLATDVPVTETYRLTFSIGTDYVGIGDVTYVYNEDLMQLAARFPEKADAGVLSMDMFVCAGHKMGGYNCFTQGDVRTIKPEYHDYVALFQIDSADGLMWGDMGLGHFFIHPDDLTKLDFSRVLYYWDCF